MTAMAARRPMASQVGAKDVSMISAASWKVRPATSQRANRNQTARRRSPVTDAKVAPGTAEERLDRPVEDHDQRHGVDQHDAVFAGDTQPFFHVWTLPLQVSGKKVLQSSFMLTSRMP